MIQRPITEERHERVLRVGFRDDSFADKRAEILPELRIGFGIVAAHFLEHVRNFSGQDLFQRQDHAIRLHRLAGHVQRDILGIDNALNKAVVAREKIGAVVLDQDLPGVKLETVLLTQREHRPFRLRRNVEERVHLERGVDGEMLLRERFLEIHRERLIKFFVVFLRDFAGRLSPERSVGVRALASVADIDRIWNVI